MKYKSVAILGLGCSGFATYNNLCKYPLRIVAWDDNLDIRKKYNEKVYLQTYEEWDFISLDIIIVSPGINLHSPKEHFIIKKAREHNIKICCDIEVFYELNPDKKYIAVTGTNGKSTVVSLLYQLFLAQNKKVTLLGNIGRPVFSTDVEDTDYIILELSSFQLELMSNFSFHCAVLLNLGEDHLDYHGSFQNYRATKEKIFYNQNKSDIAIINKSLPAEVSAKLKKQHILIIGTDVYIKDNKLVDRYFHTEKVVIDLSNIKHLKGRHNQENISFVYACCQFFGLSIDTNTLSNFDNLPHRQELVTELSNISFIDDSKATSPESTLAALENFSNIILILGGTRKRDELDILLPDLQKKVIHTFLIGASKDKFSKIFDSNKLPYTLSNTLEEAVLLAYKLGKSYKKSVTVLLSPACSSYDMFTNFQERGEAFIKVVKGLE